ncbi:hypothetical protein [Mycobacterium intracellulare]|uniref:Uncharacterized protein n=1 Tax=Mycobacterium intracellulare TaxID=1767 RepID=A0AAE4REW7_MYCIT|nr:hypothetical protein [Mycobacterium intracellulare]MDV6979140.1 hypothetical protein [Mycobacterium intracellulare]MDV6984548.1 hypothetical protein [Mycobacterium intracellulare]MDV7014554.1 hypothetical protein [Mycobacterium intracellulare]MDV7029470.1 hypothetical protein [Mycobacterium intracellulare]
MTTFHALLVAGIAVFPGAVYTIARERHGASVEGDEIEKKGGYPAGPKPAKGAPAVPQGLRKPRNQS